MASFVSDESNWPLCVTSAEGTLSYEQHMDMLHTWNGWFDRNQPFIVIRRHLNDAALDQAEGTGKATKAWMCDGAGEKIKTQVRAMCMIVPANCEVASKKPSVEAVFGVPGGIFTSWQEAIDWLEDHDWFGLHLPDHAKMVALDG